MPSIKRVDVKEGGGSERLKGEKKEERGECDYVIMSYYYTNQRGTKKDNI